MYFSDRGCVRTLRTLYVYATDPGTFLKELFEYHCTYIHTYIWLSFLALTIDVVLAYYTYSLDLFLLFFLFVWLCGWKEDIWPVENVAAVPKTFFWIHARTKNYSRKTWPVT